MNKVLNFNSIITISSSSVQDYIGSLNNEDLLVYSPTSLKLLNYDSSRLKCKVLNANIFMIKKSLLDNYLLRNSRTFRRVISLGNGRTTDTAKYLANKFKTKLISIPSALTTNSFFTNNACLYEDGEKKSFRAVIPDEVLISYDLLKKSKLKYNFYGLCDVLSIHTALHDWKLSNLRTGEHIDSLVYSLSESILDSLFKKRESITNGDFKALEGILELIMLSGFITNIAESGRPESGSEHIIAKFLEQKLPIYHAQGVASGIILMMHYQKNSSSDVTKCLKEFSLTGEIKNNKRLINVLLNMKYVHPREDRYSILDEINCFDREEIERILNSSLNY